jgi:glycosyltransferase involved in cell wall biosynthesis
MKILFLSTRAAKPSFRFRVEQMLPCFAERGHETETALLPRNVWGRGRIYARLGRYDLVLLQKRLLSWPELMVLRQRAQRLVYDLDDAVMYDSSGADDARRRSRFRAICRAADLVLCGNSFLQEEAMHAGARTVLIPTAIDADRFHPGLRHHEGDQSITVGWTGSRSTNEYLNLVLPVLAKFLGRIQLKVMSDTAEGIDFSLLKGVPYHFIPWSRRVEASEAASFDIGLMPLPDNPWTRGKCGFKALQYMALGIPAVCSPVGVNREIIHDGLDGFVPETREEWYQAISRLLKDPQLRKSIGQAGRRRVEREFALRVVGPKLVESVESLQTSARMSA